MNIQTAVADVENAALEASALAFFTDQLHIRQELHLYHDGAVALAILATAAGYVEGEVTGIVAALSRVGCRCEDLPDGIESLDVGGWVGARGSANGRLVYQNYIPQQLGPFHAPACHLVRFRPEFLRKI